jgi:hypothetical protein
MQVTFDDQCPEILYGSAMTTPTPNNNRN